MHVPMWLTLLATVAAVMAVATDRPPRALTLRRRTHMRSRRTLFDKDCPKGCKSCSQANGCVTCKPRYFLYLKRTYIRQTGVCVLSCPLGHYATNRGFMLCAKCKIANCEVCLNRKYCLQCADQFVEFRGECVHQCTDGATSLNASTPCLPKAECVAGEWSSWGVCSKKGKTCGFKYGVQTRVREMTKVPSSAGGRCPDPTENRKCRMIDRICPVISNDSEFVETDGTSTTGTRKEKQRQKERKKKKRKKKERGNRQEMTNRKRKEKTTAASNNTLKETTKSARLQELLMK